MSGPDALQGEMPGFFPGRPGGAHDEPLLDMIFDRRPLPPGAPQEMHDLARMLAAADGAAEPGELAGEAAALAAFSRFASPAGVLPPAPRWRPRRPAHGRRGLQGFRGRVRLATALIAAVAALACTAAAYIGVLPGPLQRVAHVTVGAPAPTMPRLHANKRRPSSPRHRSTPIPGAVATHGTAGATSAGQGRPRRVREPSGSGCTPYLYQAPPGWDIPDPASAWGSRNPRCPGQAAHATSVPMPSSPVKVPSTSPGARLFTPGGSSPPRGIKPSPASESSPSPPE